MLCPYCNQKMSSETYKMKYFQYIIFCENKNCPVNPCTDATTPTKAIAEIESMYKWEKDKNENYISSEM